MALTLAVTACGAKSPDWRAALLAGSIYAEPAQVVRELGYEVTDVDTIIGTLEARRWHGSRTSIRAGTRVRRADYMLLDIYTEVPSGDRVVRVVAQTVIVAQSTRTFGREAIIATESPSASVREDARALLVALGCERVQLLQRMTGVYGPQIDAWCESDES